MSYENATQIQALQIALGDSACLIYIPGLPPIYDYEVQPQRVGDPSLFMTYAH